MSGRFVRSSKYRHVHGTQLRKDQCYQFSAGLYFSGDANHVASNGKALSVALSGGGGPVALVNLENQGARVSNNAYQINVHKSKVLDMAFSPFVDNVIATASDDCLIKVSDFDTALPEGDKVSDAKATLGGHQKKVQFIQWHPVANNVLASASFDSTLKLWDVSAQEAVITVDVKETSHISWNLDGSLITAYGKDKTLRVFDPRQQDAVQETSAHGGAKAARAVFCGNSGYIASTGFTSRAAREILLWDPRAFDKPVSQVAVDQGAGTMMPHFDEDNNVLYVAGKGDGNIRYYELEGSELHFLSEFRSSESQKGACFLPKRVCDVTKCEIAIALRLMRDYCAPVSFQVPRKSDLFQEDIFPDAYAGVSALEAKEWLEGKNVDPPRRSMKPGEAKDEDRTAKLEVGKSRADLQQELDAANARIKELEEEVAKLKAA